MYLDLQNTLYMSEHWLFVALILFVCGFFYLIIRSFLVSQFKLKQLESIKTGKEKTLLLRLQAYERLTLFLERLTPDQLLFRSLKKSNDSSVLTQAKVLKNIRAEYDHNVAQQIYIKQSTWEHIKRAKEEVAKCANLALKTVGPKATSMQYIQEVMNQFNNLEENPIKQSLTLIKQEAKELF